MFKNLIFLFHLILGSHLLTAQTKEIIYLSGTDNMHTTEWDFWCTGGRNSGYWSKIQVPSHWEQQGFGAYNYGRDYVTYGKNFRFEEEKGIYKFKFKVPQQWRGKVVNLVFEGSMTDTEVKVNGKLAGDIHQGSFYRFKYNITDKIHFEKDNELQATVSKMSADASVNNAERLADYWIFGGIFRPVYLEALPEEHIDWTAIDARADGALAINVHLNYKSKEREITAEIIDAAGKQVGNVSATSTGDSVVQLKTQINKPNLWTAETPHLYRVKICVHNGKTKLFETTEKFGFRTVEIRRGDGVFVNGTKIKFKGVNRHVWWPETGRAVGPDIDLMDVKLMKEMNMNAVRCSHYPPDKKFLAFCDSLGLYVLDELAGWQKAYSTKAGEPLVKEMVVRDVNHPSIIIWSNGNEGGHNFDLDDDYALYDLSKRPVIHAHHKPGNAFNGIDCNHYEDYYSTKKILDDSLIYMPTEFLHSQDDGGGGASLADFWELHWNSKRGAGGFLWALADEGIVRTDLNGLIDVNGVNAPDGLVGPHRQREGSVNAIREIYSPIRITLKELPNNFKGEITVENRYHFTNTDQCTFRWQLINFNNPSGRSEVNTVVKTGVTKPPSILPAHTGVININLPADWKNYDALTLAASDPHKNEVYKWVWKIKSNKQLLQKILIESKDSVAVSETDSTVVMKANGILVAIGKNDGRLNNLANDQSSKLSFNNGPLLVSGSSAFISLKHFKEKEAYVVEAHYSGNLKYVRWMMHGSGWLEMEYEYAINGSFPFAGISFAYPENFVLGAKWLGKGPSRVWKNRMQGVTTGVWENRYNNTHTGSAPWVYPEFKGYFADITWMEMNTVEGKFTIASKEENLFVRLFDFYGLSGKIPHPTLPAGNISFLDHIPPIGTKLALNINPKTANLGPSGEWSKIDAPIKNVLYFYFGLPASNVSTQFLMPKENILTD